MADPTIQTTTGAVSFNAIVASIKERLALAGVLRDDPEEAESTDSDFIRVVAVPEDKIAAYLSDTGVLLNIGAPVPVPSSGGGRWDYRVSRIVSVIICTVNLSDPGGRDDEAVRLHILKEEAVVDALLLQPPVGAANNNTIPYAIHWVPGGEQIARQVNKDPGQLVSVLPYEVRYRSPVSVLRL